MPLKDYSLPINKTGTLSSKIPTVDAAKRGSTGPIHEKSKKMQLTAPTFKTNRLVDQAFSTMYKY